MTTQSFYQLEIQVKNVEFALELQKGYNNLGMEEMPYEGKYLGLESV